MKYDLLQRDYLAATDQMKKTVGILSSENEQHIFKRNGTTLIHNTSKDKRGYVCMHIETENIKFTLDYETPLRVHQKQQKLVKDTARICGGSTGDKEKVQMKTGSKPCMVCGVHKIVKISRAAEAAFYRQFNVPKQLALSYKTLMKGCNAAENVAHCCF